MRQKFQHINIYDINTCFSEKTLTNTISSSRVFDDCIPMFGGNSPSVRMPLKIHSIDHRSYSSIIGVLCRK